jgi:two-component system KDP operon response regulator KdpE
MAAEPSSVLIVEDDRAQLRALSLMLARHGHRVLAATTGAEALRVVGAVPPDLIVLDLGLPDIDGLTLLRHLRVLQPCPIVVVTADFAEDRIVDALDRGASDYITKPFSVDVLMARMRAALRQGEVAALVLREEVLTAGDVALDMNSYRVRIGDDEVDLHPRQFDLLALLIRYQGKVVTHSTIARAWGIASELGDDPLNVNPWRVSISKIRKQLGVGPRRPVVETEHHVGYRLVVPISSDAAEP